MASLTAGSTIVAIIAGLSIAPGDVRAAAGADVAVASATPTPTPSATITMPTVVEPAQPIVRSAVVAADGSPAGPVTGGTVVTVTGTDLADVTSASFGENPAQVVSATTDTVTLQTPAATGLSTGSVAVSLYASTGEAVAVAGGAGVDTTSASAAATAALTDAIEPTADAAITVPSTSAATTDPPVLTFTYVPDPRITAQIDYVLAHWQNYNSAAYGSISGNDCVNFTSQSLIARGWTMDADWSYVAGKYSSAWASSTAFAAYLAAHPERATPLTAAQRAEVKVGDIVQFDWDNSGDKDHTGIVTRVEQTSTGVDIYYAGHTNNTDYRSVDESLALSGGSVTYWSVA
ncbi:amidase domain-containing protein [Cryobacterium sp. SO2]|uniref:amidase domain-containing protein n=1 Tax=Cryobacterium sp. SO2 TaxID=1897060 RepID=UPI00223C93BE|nr:amidase domain-containing protein [Cryobacterium sp. SO2]WEO77656.1 amidase domain-containing protein [Cryobacterium sp. SO2]